MFELKKCFNAEDMPSQVRQEFIQHVKSDGEIVAPSGYPYVVDWNVDTEVSSVKMVERWLVANGAVDGEDVMITTSPEELNSQVTL